MNDIFLQIKKDFPIFTQHTSLSYLDSTATTLKPKPVIYKLIEYYQQYSANVFRGIYPLSEKATEEFETTRQTVAHFINAQPEEIIFTRNTTESLNLLTYSLGRKIIEKGEEIISTIMEHHSNFVPWQILAQETGATLKVIDINDQGYLELGEKNGSFDLESIVTKKTKIITLTYVSNVLGTINPIKEIVNAAKKINPKIIIIIDAAQAIAHLPIDVKNLGVDFLAFSSHKMLGPTGVGVLWGRYQLLEEIFPFMYGGEMIESVSLEKTLFKKTPHKFEAGTPAIGEVIGLQEAVKYLQKIGLKNIQQYLKNLTQKAYLSLKTVFGQKITFYGPTDFNQKGPILAFNLCDYHPHDVAQILADEGVSVRAGHHCAMPLHQRLNTEKGTVRASFYVYNDEKDIKRLIEGLNKCIKILQ